MLSWGGGTWVIVIGNGTGICVGDITVATADGTGVGGNCIGGGIDSCTIDVCMGVGS